MRSKVRRVEHSVLTMRICTPALAALIRAVRTQVHQHVLYAGMLPQLQDSFQDPPQVLSWEGRRPASFPLVLNQALRYGLRLTALDEITTV